jgi:hypothetical protein
MCSTGRPGRCEAPSQTFGTALSKVGSMRWCKGILRSSSKRVAPLTGTGFESFMLGLHKRQGDQSYPDLAISIEVMLALMEKFEGAWELARGNLREEGAVLFPALFSVVTFCGGFCGEETPLMDLEGTRSKFEEIGRDRLPHVVVALIGRFKNEIGELHHMLPLAAVTKSGLKSRQWIVKMIYWYQRQGVTNGPVFLQDGRVGTSEHVRVQYPHGAGRYSERRRRRHKQDDRCFREVRSESLFSERLEHSCD